jgi:hypothetical protein
MRLMNASPGRLKERMPGSYDSIKVRPWAVFLFFQEITEAIPGKFPVGYRTAERDLPIRYTDNLPVPVAWAVLDVNLLPNLKRV